MDNTSLPYRAGEPIRRAFMRRSVKNTLRAGALCLVLLVCALFTTALAAAGTS